MMLAKVLVALIPAVLLLVGSLLNLIRMPADTAAAVTTALDRILRWLIEIHMAAEAVTGAAEAKALIAANPTGTTQAARVEFNAALETSVLEEYRQIVTDPQRAEYHQVPAVALPALRDVSEAAIRTRIQELVAEHNQEREVITTAQKTSHAALHGPAAGHARLDALTAGQYLHADDAALKRLLSAWPPRAPAPKKGDQK